MTQWQPGVTLAEVEQHTIIAALKFYHGNRTLASNALGISLRTLTARIDQYRKAGLKLPDSFGRVMEVEEQAG